MVLAGGLAVHQPALQLAVRDRLNSVGMTDVRALDRDPVYGAVNLAQALLARPAGARPTAGARS